LNNRLLNSKIKAEDLCRREKLTTYAQIENLDSSSELMKNKDLKIKKS